MSARNTVDLKNYEQELALREGGQQMVLSHYRLTRVLEGSDFCRDTRMKEGQACDVDESAEPTVSLFRYDPIHFLCNALLQASDKAS